MGSAQGKGVREGQAPQTRREISSQLPARKEATWSRSKKERRVRRDEEEPVCIEWESSKDLDQYVKMMLICQRCWNQCCVCFRRINHMGLEPFAFILWCYVTVRQNVTSGTRMTWIYPQPETIKCLDLLRNSSTEGMDLLRTWNFQGLVTSS